MSNSQFDSYRLTVDRHINGGFFDAFHSADRGEDDSGNVFAFVEYRIDGTQSGFHNSAGNSEDNSRSGGFSERIVIVFFRKVLKVETGVFDHSGKFACGDDSVNIGNSRVALKLRANAFGLLSGAGHYRDAVNLLYGDTLGFRPVGFGNSSEHSLR